MWDKLPKDIILYEILPQCSIDLRLALKVKPKKINVMNYENIRTTLEKKVHEMAELPPIGCNILSRVRFSNKTGYSITYRVLTFDIEVRVTKFLHEKSYHVGTIRY